MSTQPKPPVFLERRGYRQRRMMDALRLLPFFGVLLWFLPLFWPSGPFPQDATEPVTTSAAVIYVFAVWASLIGLSFALRRALRPTLDQQVAELDDAGTSKAR